MLLVAQTFYITYQTSSATEPLKMGNGNQTIGDESAKLNSLATAVFCSAHKIEECGEKMAQVARKYRN